MSRLNSFAHMRYIQGLILYVQTRRFSTVLVEASGILQFLSLRINCLFVFVALRPKSTALVIAGRSVHLKLHTL